MSESITSTPEPEITVTIAMSSGLLFKQEQQSNGPAFYFVKALKDFNAIHKRQLFKVILISDNPSLDFLSSKINDDKLEDLITVLTVSEDQLVKELQRNKTHLYLSDNRMVNVQEAVNEGIAAAVMFSTEKMSSLSGKTLDFAFDGVGVLFSNEQEQENDPTLMNEGPLKRFLEVLINLKTNHNCSITTYLVTRLGDDTSKALKTLQTWDLKVDEAVFLQQPENASTLERIRPHIFFAPYQNKGVGWRMHQWHAWCLSKNQ
ncbi:hypothetical protein ACER0C_003483 [Sarotherodon galilaeus]